MRGDRRYTLIIVPLALALVIAFIVLATRQDVGPAGEAISSGQTQAQPTAPPPSPTSAPAPQPTATVVEAAALAAPELEEYVSVTQIFSAGVPAGWPVVEALPGANLVMANSHAALERYQNGETIAPGDFVLNVGFLPYRLLQTNELRTLDIQLDATPDVFLQSLLPMFRTAKETAVGEVELVSLNEQRQAGLLAVAAAEQEGAILMIPAGENVIALVSAVAAPGELVELQATAYAVAAGLAFSGNHDELYGLLLGS